MTTRHRRLLVVALCLDIVGAAGCGGGQPGKARDGADASAVNGSITVFAAASLTDAFTEAADAFHADHPGATVELDLAGSSSLREQILAGAPADVFASASAATMEPVVEAGEVEGDVRVLAHNALEIVVPAGNPGDVAGLADFADASLLVGLCAAEVPCGEAGRAALAAAGVTPEPDTDEPDVRSLLTKVEAGELDAGLVYRTDVLAAGDTVEGIAIPDDDNVTSDYLVATLAGGDEPAVAAAFMDFLLSADGQAILESYGFVPA